MSSPIQLDGPYRSRTQRRIERLQRVVWTIVAVCGLLVGVPLLTGLAYGLWLYR